MSQIRCIGTGLKRAQANLPASLCVQSILLPAGFVFFVVGFTVGDYPFALVGVLLVYASNLVYAFRNLRQRILFLFLHLGMALFLLSRPIVGLLDETKTWEFARADTTEFALLALFVSLIAMFFGAFLYSFFVTHNERYRAKRDAHRVPLANALDEGVCLSANEKAGLHERWLKSMRIASFVCLLFCLLGSYAAGAIKLAYMDGLSYEDYYLISVSDHVPWVIDVLGTICPYVFCSYLATMPKRTPVLVMFVLYIGTTLPMLIIGSRADFVISCLFCMLYFALRARSDREEAWVGKRELLVAAVCVPAGVFFMGLWTYIRADAVVELTGFAETVIDAFYKQGVSFTVLGYGYQVDPQIQDLGFRFFSIGSFISNITQGFIGQTFFGCEYLGDTNSALLALNGNSYAHTMSYFAHANYLGGEGYGSSYILELYADFGYMGIAVGSVIIAFALSALSASIGRSWFWGMCALISASSVFHMPRGYAVEWISFIWTTRFVFVAVLLLAAAYLVRAFFMERDFSTEVYDGSGRTGRITCVERLARINAVRLGNRAEVADSLNGDGDDQCRNCAGEH